MITIGAGAGKDALSLLGDARPRTAAVLAQPTVAATADAVAAAVAATGAAVAVRIMPDGEAAKSLAAVEEAYRWLNDLGVTRHDRIVGVGGGALTDAAGFVAATYLRGLAVTLVPTTLLGAVDAAIGGKTAVTVDGKNLVGVFRHPDRVAIDLDVLAAAPEAALRAGHAEAVKAGFIADAALMALYEAQGPAVDLAAVVTKAVAVKVAVVEEDFREGGRRAVLNYGHTVGHAVEAAAGIPHGEAVAIGMVAAAAASERVTGFSGAARQRAILQSLRLPVTAPPVDRDRVRRLMDLDKKRDDRGLRMVLLEDFGRPVVMPVDGATVEAALEAVGLG